MNPVPSIAFAVAMTAAGYPVLAQTSSPQQPSSGAAATYHMDQQMESMRGMHERMMGASPEQRRGAMDEHMKMMQDGMAMMRDMGCMGGAQGSSLSQSVMDKCMQMMQMMMQMRQTMGPPPPKQ